MLAQLHGRLVEVETGRGQLVLVCGEAGIGKTAVVEAFCTEAAKEAPVLWGACDPVAPARPFAPVIDIVGAGEGPLRDALRCKGQEWSLRRLPRTAA